MQGFREFFTKDKGKDKFVSTVKKQFGVNKNIWLAMPILVSNTKLGNHKITTPTMFYVKEFDDNSVTLVNVLDVGQPDDQEYDSDGEIDMDKGTPHGRFEITISRKDFDQLQMPQTFQGMDATQLKPGGSL